MEDMLSFVSRKIKNADSLSMQQLISEMGLSKSKFYRFMQEPWRFSDDEIERLSEILKFTEEDIRILEGFRNGDVKKIVPALPSIIDTDNETSEINDVLFNMIFGNFPIQQDYQSKVYTLFDANEGDSQYESDGVIKCSASDIADIISDNLLVTNIIDVHPIFKMCVFNTYNSSKVQRLHSLITQIIEIDAVKNYYSLSAKHVINSKSLNVLNKFRAYSELKCLNNLGFYVIDFVDLEKSGLCNMDCCIMQYTSNDGGSKYVFTIFPPSGDPIVYLFSNISLFEFLIYRFSDLFYMEDDCFHYNNGDIMTYNNQVIDLLSKFKRVTVDPGLFSDVVLDELWIATKKKIVSDANLLKATRRTLDPDGIYKVYSDAQYIETLFDSCIERFYLNEESEAINIMYASGLKEFADNGYTTESSWLNISIPYELRIRELEYIKARLGNSFSGRSQKFYIIIPGYCASQTAFCVLGNHAVHLSNDPYKEDKLSQTILSQKDMATVLYNYIHDELIPDDRRKRYNSPLFTDERAAAFIDSLIDEVKERMAKNENQEN